VVAVHKPVLVHAEPAEAHKSRSEPGEVGVGMADIVVWSYQQSLVGNVAEEPASLVLHGLLEALFARYSRCYAQWQGLPRLVSHSMALEHHRCCQIRREMFGQTRKLDSELAVVEVRCTTHGVYDLV
jgi:hypothetical protein